MARFFTILLLLAGTIAAAEESDVELDVKPVLCIIDSRTPACDMHFLIAWQSGIRGYYCLFSQLATAPLRCWTEAAAGSHAEHRTIDESFRYWLTRDNGNEPLAAVMVEVMSTETDRRRKRRSRHVWDIL
jgi:hypothetical protein